ncbi:P-loop containing nucleoside triphosphate hydrolase protein [Radiomyces spectabilis]|uniref:P-loop containing nucleoside triphosphate hydrolase protein n=1 Tax=Radiomyces spectabilis TaxID=64574 RepID=UPI002220329D|nr:P-loop containing nucleoside triphosphate hydrolase protein [Radiomyces spectabilis]KAI8364781.1 P-loop containing nucleoside triphosphate hydrolase protein [Radiomyces spectabilis]
MILILVKEQHQNDSIETHHIHWHHVEAVLGIVRPSNLNEYASKVPDVRFSDIYGIDDIVETIQASVIYPFHHPEEYQLMGIHPPRGIILYGPPGVGKTMLCSALASEAGINFMFVESSHIRSKVVGESEKNIAKLFASARANAPCILFIDQIDMLLPKRGSSRTSENTSDRIVTSFLTATNRIEVMDPAVLRHGRFDEHIHVPIPNAETRAAIIRGLCAKMPVVMNDEDIAQLVHETYHWSGSNKNQFTRVKYIVSLFLFFFPNMQEQKSIIYSERLLWPAYERMSTTRQ